MTAARWKELGIFIVALVGIYFMVSRKAASLQRDDINPLGYWIAFGAIALAIVLTWVDVIKKHA